MAVERSYIRWIFVPFCLLLILVPLHGLAQQDTLDRVLPDTVDRSSDTLTVAESERRDAGSAEEEEPLDPEAVDESELRAVARALVAIDELRQMYHTRQGAPSDTTSGAASDLYEEFLAEANQIIEDQGITVEHYSRIVAAARRDPEMRRRLTRVIQETR